MTWQRAETGQPRLDFFALLTQHEDYAGTTDSDLAYMAQSCCELWYYSGDVQINLVVRTAPKRAKVVMGVPAVGADPMVVCRTLIAKIREIMDGHGISQWHAKFLSEYQSQTLQAVCDCVDRVCWEVTDKIAGPKNVKFNFNRVSTRRPEDADYQGPAHEGSL